MFFRFLGKLFFYFWIVPTLTKGIKLGLNTAVEMLVYGEKETIQKRRTAACRSRRTDYRDHPPMT